MFKEVNTATNLPAQIDLYATPGDYYKFLFMAKVGRRRARAARTELILYWEHRSAASP
jgi:fumarate hydratase class I